MRMGRAISRAGVGEAPQVRYDYRVAFRVLRFIGSDTPLVVVSILVMFVYSATIVATPWIIQRAIDSVVTGHSSSGLRNAAIFLVVNAVAGYLSNYVHLTTLSRVGQNLLLRLRRATFDHIQRLSLSYFDRMEVGSIMSRVQNDVQQLQEFLAIFVLTISDLVVLIGIVVAMLLMKWELALITFGVVPVLVIMMIFWQGYALRVFMRVRREIAQVTAELQENISGVRVIQSLNRQDKNLQHFEGTSQRYLNTSLGATRLTAALNPSVELLSAVAHGPGHHLRRRPGVEGGPGHGGSACGLRPLHTALLRSHTQPDHAVRAAPEGNGFGPAHLRDPGHRTTDRRSAGSSPLTPPARGGRLREGQL